MDTPPGLETALARLLMHQNVRTSPQARMAIVDLLELSLNQEHHNGSKGVSVGALERMSGLAFRPARRSELLEALEAVSHLAKQQRRAIGLRLLKREENRLLFTLLEQSGWSRPPWLASPERDGLTAAGPHEYILRTRHRANRGESLQLLHIARMNWLKRLAASSSPEAWRSRGLINELLGVQFWSGPWQRSEQAQVPEFYRVTLGALPVQLRLVVGGAWYLAKQEHLAHLPEIVGVTGPLPVQLPMQIDTYPFFQALKQQVLERSQSEKRLQGEFPSSEEPLTPSLVRRQLQVARSRIYLWVLGISGLKQDNERRVLLAATALAHGKPERLERWLQGAPIGEAEAETLSRQVHEWQHRVSIPPEDIPPYLSSAGKQLYQLWKGLRKEG